MEITDDVNSVKRTVYKEKAVLVAALDPSTPSGKYVIDMLCVLEKTFRKKNIKFKVISVRGAEPVISFFINGREMFRQDSVFGSRDKDLSALKMSIRNVIDEISSI